MTRLQARSLLVLLLLIASMSLVLLNQSGWLAPAKGVVMVPFAALQRGVTGLAAGLRNYSERNPDVEALRQRNQELEAQVADLETELVKLRENEADLRILSALLEYARTQPEHRYAAANVISRDSDPFLSYIIIDIGSDQGVARDMPVVSNLGLVGRVVEVTCCASKVQLVIDPASAVNARLQASRDEGVAVGQIAGGLELQYLSQQAEVAAGDIVLTSGLGGKFPPGLVIGRISAVQRLDYEVLQTAIVTPGVNFNRLEIVLVITNFRPVNLAPFVPAGEAAAAP